MATSSRIVEVENASHEKLGNCRLSRAIAMVLHNEAIIVESDESRIVQTANGDSFPFPVIIRLLQYKKVDFYSADEEFSRTGIFRRDNYTCGYCGKKSGENRTWDHIFPKSKGGEDSWLNAITACFKCNNKKGNRTPEEAGMPLLWEPKIPTRIYFFTENSKRAPSYK
jgi:hypothetical protein